MRFMLAFVFAFWASTTLSQTTTSSVESDLARDGLAATIARLSANHTTQGFEIGMLQTLRAVEKTLQTRYEYGLGQSLIGLPLLRIRNRDFSNPTPKPSGPETITSIVDGFVTDLEQARTTLEEAETTGIVPFEMALTDIWFDINADGVRNATEGAVTLLGPIILGRITFRQFTDSDAGKDPLVVRFDATDHAWLLAYTHMLSGVGNLFIAFDPEPVLHDLTARRAALADAPQIPAYYDPEVVLAEIATLETEEMQLKQQQQELREHIKPISDDIRDLRKALRKTDDETLKADLTAQRDLKGSELQPLNTELRQHGQMARIIRNEIASARAKLPPDADTFLRKSFARSTAADMLPAFDAFYVLITALKQNPDPARVRAANDHMHAMIAHNRVFWSRLAEETDNNREWIPNAVQNSVLPLTIPPRVAEGWQNILLDIEAVLEGKLLIQHPLLPEGYGISLPAYVNAPSPVDPIGWIHGIDLYRYAAKGPRLTLQSWRAFQRLTFGNGGPFALFLN
jgi:hypothetical protein